jgi:hypothetical protein
MLGLELLRSSNQRQRLSILLLGVGILCWAWLIFFISNPFLYAAPVQGLQHMLGLVDFINAREFDWKTDTLAEKIWAVQHLSRHFVPFNQLGLPLDLFVILPATVFFGYWLLHRSDVARQQQLDLITIWILVSLIGTTLWIPAAYPRYVLPIQPGIAFLAGFGIAQLGRWLFVRYGSAKVEE